MYISATRVVFILPYGKDPRYRSALFRVINRIKVELFINPKGQMTYSSNDPTVFDGHLWDQGRKWQNQNVVIFVDIPNQSENELLPILINLRTEINAELARARDGKTGQNVWITAQPMFILHN